MPTLTGAVVIEDELRLALHKVKQNRKLQVDARLHRPFRVWDGAILTSMHAVYGGLGLTLDKA